MKSSSEYRAQAKQALVGKWGVAIGIILINMLIVGALSSTVIGALLVAGALDVGVAITFTQLYRNPNAFEIGGMFSGFSNGSFPETILLNLLRSIFVALWSLLFFIPGIVKGYSYSMSSYILADHPELGGLGAITASKNLMKGKKWALFCLDFSYIGWLILCTLTFGILYLWVTPWMAAAHAAFYESIKDEVQTA